MIDRLAGMWRSVRQPTSRGNGEIASFELGSFTLHGGTRLEAERPLRFGGSGPAWSYLVSWENHSPIHQVTNRGLKVELDVCVRSGRLEVGLLAGDLESFVDRVELADGAQHVVLQAPLATSAAALVVRSRADGPSSFDVSGVSSEVIAKSKVRERGFLRKSVTDDLAARVKAAKPVIVDVGANKGDTVAHFLATFPAAEIWALEPHPETFAGMARRFAGVPQIHPHQLALSSRSGRATMHSYTNAAINSLSPVAAGAQDLVDGAVVASPTVEVALQSLTEFCGREGIDHIDILKLDTQGHEFDILHGEREFLASGRIRFVLVELLFSPLYASQAKAGEVIGLLEGSGFKLFDFYDFIYDETRGLKWGDALFEVATVS
jgi:FkbM family methyltransferase